MPTGKPGVGTLGRLVELDGSLMEEDELVRVVDTVLRCGASASISTVAVTPRRLG
jgi:hypothetical protein